MKTIWEILHLDTPTNDIEEIKQAYSKQTKLYNPEENPEQFQEIHNAYKQAIKYAKSNNNRNQELNKPNKLPDFEINSKFNKYENILKKNLKENELHDKNIEFNNILKEQQNSKKEYIIEKEFSQIYEENILEQENIESFKNYIIEENEDEFINKIIPIIEFGLKKNYKKLEKVVTSSDFEKALKYEKFQLELAKVLINNPNANFNSIVLVEKSCIKYKKLDSNNKLINSLEKYFGNVIEKQKQQKKYTIIVYFIGIAMIIAASSISSVTSNNTNNTVNKIPQLAPISRNLTTNENEIETFDRIKVKYQIPKGFKVNQISNNYKTLKSENNKVKISISSKYTITQTYEEFLKDNVEYYKEKPDIYSDVKLTMLDDIQTENYVYNQAEITYTDKGVYSDDSNKKETYLWTKVSDFATLYFQIEHVEDLNQDQLKTLLQIEVISKQETSEQNEE